jgi:hypothetical protein
MLAQNRRRHTDEFEDLDPYFTGVEAVECLITLEGDRLPQTILETAVGDGAIAKALQAHGRDVRAIDIYPYEGRPADTMIGDYFDLAPIAGIDGAITNPPYKKALAFIEKMIAEYRYVAVLVRTNFYTEAAERDDFFEKYPPTRMWFASRRLLMMHRYRWAGPKKSSNMPLLAGVGARPAADATATLRLEESARRHQVGAAAGTRQAASSPNPLAG